MLRYRSKKINMPRLVTLLLAAMLVAGSCMTAACEEAVPPEAESKPITNEAQGLIQLETPKNLRKEDGALVWDEVEHASGYLLFFEYDSYDVESNSFDLSLLAETGLYSLELLARGDGVAYTDSEWTEYSFVWIMPSRVDAEEEPAKDPAETIALSYDERGFHYTLLEDGSGYSLSGGVAEEMGNMEGFVDLPDTFRGLPVKEIADFAFYNTEIQDGVANFPNACTEYLCNTITTGIELPAQLERIGERAFSAMVRIEEVVIPDSVTVIGEGAFADCTHLRRVTLPQGLKSIPSQCFLRCALEEIALPEGLERIEYRAFNSQCYCYDADTCLVIGNQFTEIIIPDSVTQIGEAAFDACRLLKDITFSSGLEKLGGGVFSRTAWYNDLDDGLIVINNKILYGYKGVAPENYKLHIAAPIEYIVDYAFAVYDNEQAAKYRLTEVYIDDGIEMGRNVFSGCTALRRVRLPADMKVVPAQTFSNCSALESVIFPEGLTEIGVCAFILCSALNEIDLPDTLVEIGNNAFYKTAIRSVYIPASVTEIGTTPFSYGPSAITVYYGGTEAQWEALNLRPGKMAHYVLCTATVYYYCEGEPALNEDGTAYLGNYWHYDANGNITIWSKESEE